eukprot:scaffold51237_cov41-Cyclotella_meneghiniana.AAC.1
MASTTYWHGRVDIDIGGFDDTDIGRFDDTDIRGFNVNAVITMRGRGCNLPWMLTNGQLKG